LRYGNTTGLADVDAFVAERKKSVVPVVGHTGIGDFQNIHTDGGRLQSLLDIELRQEIRTDVVAARPYATTTLTYIIAVTIVLNESI